jgi:ribose-phosphate pyrophosphokinase
MQAIASLPLKRLVVTNTLPQSHREPMCPTQQDQGFDIVDITTTIAESIRRTHNGESMCVVTACWGEHAVEIGPDSRD